jgi:hypothetical protein
MSTKAKFLILLDAFFKPFRNRLFLLSNLYPEGLYFTPKALNKDMRHRNLTLE